MKNIKDNSITAIDLGSNSFRVLHFDCSNSTQLGQFEIAVGLADGLATTGMISKEAVDRVVKAIENSIEKIGYDPTKAVAVTTQAMRTAKNSSEVIETVFEKTGVRFYIIDAHVEAKLTLLAMQTALKRESIKGDDFLLLDIGGGSTELIIYQNNKEQIKSFEYGIVTLAQSLSKDEDFKEFETQIYEFVKECNLKESIFISTAGTPTTIAALKCGLNFKTYDKNIINGTVLNPCEIVEIQNELRSLSQEQLIERVGSGRDDFIDTGINIFKLFYKVLKKDSSIVFDDGLREGVAIEYCLNQKR